MLNLQFRFYKKNRETSLTLCALLIAQIFPVVYRTPPFMILITTFSIHHSYWSKMFILRKECHI